MPRLVAAFALLGLALSSLTGTAAVAETAPPTVAAAPAPDVTAVRSGNWSARTTWGGDLPQAGEVVSIPEGVTVVLDTSTPHLLGIDVYGTLRFARKNLTLRTGYVVVFGHMEIGTAAAPFLQRAQIVLDGPSSLNAHEVGTSVLGIYGVLDVHGARRTTWTRLTRTAAAGSRRIRVADADGWQRGDEIVIASTDLDPSHAEQRTVTGRDGRVLTLNAQLRHPHFSGVERVDGRNVPQRAEVGLLTRTVQFRGGPDAASTGIGGHLIVRDGATARIGYAEFVRMGQAGVLGRYPIHFHLVRDASTSWVVGNAIHHTLQRCVTIHGTSNLRVKDNVGFESKGHCYFFEDAVETNNTLLCNLGLSTKRPMPGKQLIESDNEPSTFWVSHPNNTLIKNVAAGSVGNGFWYDLPETSTGLHEGQVHPRTAPMGRFENNVAHSNAGSAEFRSNAGLIVEDYTPTSEAVFSNMLAYKNDGFGVWADDVTVERAVLAANGVGFLGRSSLLRDSLVVGNTKNTHEVPWGILGAGFYVDAARISNTTFARFRHPEPRRAAAFGSLVNQSLGVPRVSNVKVLDSRRVRMSTTWRSNDPAVAFRDADGSVMGTGKPATVVSDYPLLETRGCTENYAIGGYVCPSGLDVAALRMHDRTGSRTPFDNAMIVRDDGVSAEALTAPDMGVSANATVLMNHSFRFRPGRETPRRVEWTVTTADAGWVEMAMPWPYDQAYVYEGYAHQWAQPLEPAANRAEFREGGRYWRHDGLIEVRFRTTEGQKWHWQSVCAERNCGAGVGSATARRRTSSPPSGGSS